MPTKQQPIKLKKQNTMVTELMRAVNHFIVEYAHKATANQIRDNSYRSCRLATSLISYSFL